MRHLRTLYTRKHIIMHKFCCCCCCFSFCDAPLLYFIALEWKGWHKILYTYSSLSRLTNDKIQSRKFCYNSRDDICKLIDQIHMFAISIMRWHTLYLMPKTLSVITDFVPYWLRISSSVYVAAFASNTKNILIHSHTYIPMD